MFEHDSASLLVAVPPFCKVDVPVMSHLVINYMHVVNYRELFCNSKDFPTCIYTAWIPNEILPCKKCDFYFVSTITEGIMGHLPVL